MPRTTPALKRRAIVVAAAMLCAPAFAGMALAAIGATGGGDQAGLGTLAGNHGLRGKATPVASSTAAPVSRAKIKPNPQTGPPKAHSAGARKAPAPPAKQPTQPASPPAHRAPAPPRSRSTPPPTYPTDPSQPGAPTDSTSTTPTTPTTTGGGTSTTGGSTDGSGSGSGSGTYGYTYPGGG